MRCEPTLYHYDGYCFNQGRVPQGQIAMPAHACLEMDEEKAITTIIRS